MKKESNIIIRVDEETKNRFQELVERYDTTMSYVLNECMIDMVNKNDIPLKIRSRLSAERIKKQLDEQGILQADRK